MQPRIEKITIEKLDQRGIATNFGTHSMRYTLYLDNGEVHTAATTIKPTVKEARPILDALLDRAELGQCNQRKVII